MIALGLMITMMAAVVPLAKVNFTTVYAASEADEAFVIQDGTLIEYLQDGISVVVPDGVTDIDAHAFWRCESLTTVTIPASVTAIGDEVFPYSENLQEVYYLGSEEEWNEIAIGKDNAPLTSATVHYNSADVPQATDAPPEIAVQPADVTLSAGKEATFTVKAKNSKGLRYQWQFSDDQGATWCDASATGTEYTVKVDWSNDGRLVRCIVSDRTGASVTSKSAKLAMEPVPFEHVISASFYESMITRQLCYDAFADRMTEEEVLRIIEDDVEKGETVYETAEGFEITNRWEGGENVNVLTKYNGSDTHIVIPEGVTHIKRYMWVDAESITFPASFAAEPYFTQYEDVFSSVMWLSGLKEINVAKDNPYYASRDGVLFNKDFTELIRYPAGKTGESYTIPNTVTSIAPLPFRSVI